MMKKRIIATALAMSFMLSGCSIPGVIKEKIGEKLSEKASSLFGAKKEESGDLKEVLEGTWIRSDGSALYGAKLEISFENEKGKAVLRAVPKNSYGFVEGDIKWKDINITGENSFTFEELSENETSSKYLPAEAIFDSEDMTILVSTADSLYQMWVKSGYMESIEKPQTQNEADVDFLFPSDVKLISESDLDKHTKEEVAIIRNEIYARHGYIFKTEPFITYFNGKSWYSKNENFHEGMLNDIERANREFIVAYEQKRGWR